MLRLKERRHFAVLTGIALETLRIALLLHAVPPRAGGQDRQAISPIPPGINTDPKRIAVGERLFRDVRLSRDSHHSCETCHPLDHGGMDGLPVANSPVGAPHLRNTLTVFNVGLSSTYNWDGATDSLEQHTDLVLASPALMNISWQELLTRVRRDSWYVSAFRSAYSQVTRAAVLNAIATFERSLLTPNSRFDRYLRGERDALTSREKEGYQLFEA
jgi:cytochrome c peroxidase